MLNARQNAFDIVRTLKDAGWDAYIAGGAVRDACMGLIPLDYDVVTQAPHDAIRNLFRNHRVAEVGASFKVCLVDGVEVATYRRAPSIPGVEESSDLLEDDLARRDLTINAMAYCPDTDTVVDPHGGRDDLKHRIIRFTGSPEERIREDPCRIIRACRFLSWLEGKFDADTLDALKHHNRHVGGVAPERIRQELLKAMACRRPGLFFNALHDIGSLVFISPAFESCFDQDGGPHHGETIAEHAILVGDLLPAGKPMLRIAGYWHDHGKPVSARIREGKRTFYGHARESARIAENELRRLMFSNREISFAASLIRHHMRSLHDGMTPRAARRLLKALRDDEVSWKDWIRLKIADNRGNRKAAPKNRRDIKRLVMCLYRQANPGGKPAVLSIGDLAVNGHDVMQALGIGPGPAVGAAMRRLLERVIADPDANSRDALLQWITAES